MVAGRGTPDQAPARLAALINPDFFEALIDRLVEASIGYLVGQLKAGADAVQIFDTWSGVLDPESFRRWTIRPIKRIVDGVRAQVPGARIIAFPKGATLAGLTELVLATGVNGVGLDWAAERRATRLALGGRCALQGNLDPLALIAGGERAGPCHRRADAGFPWRRAYLQSRPRHPPGDTDRSCRADDRAGAGIVRIDADGRRLGRPRRAAMG